MSPESTAPSGQALPAGTRLEEFEVERVLGTGGFGITYLARDTSLGRQVVIKENLPSAFAFRDTASGTVRSRSDLTEDEDNFRWSMKNFLREADTLASLKHPGIVQVLRKFEANGTAYFVMPFEKGAAFDQYLESRKEQGTPLSEDELRGLLEHVLDALDYLHARGIYHRDIKPGNILVTKKGVPILIDFGAARQRLSERSMTVVESPGYTPFEQVESGGNVGPWSDLYALGATVSKAITGQTPPKSADRMRKDPYVWLASRPELQTRYSEGFLSSLDRVLQLEESARWQNAGEWSMSLSGSDDEKKESLPPLRRSPGFDVMLPVTWQAAAEKGDPLAMALLGDTLCWGGFAASGILKDVPAGVELVKKSADKKHPLGLYIFSVIQRSLPGYQTHPGIADETERESIVQGFLRDGGSGGPVWWTAEAAHYICQKALGRQALNKDLGGDCLTKAVGLLKRSLDTGCLDAWAAYGNCLFKGLGIARDRAEGIHWISKAAGLGYGAAMTYLARCYRTGTGVRKDRGLAMTWYRRAAKAGEDDALNDLGYFCREGLFRRKNIAESADYYRQAAEAGHPRAMYNLAFFYENGIGMDKDVAKALQWYEKAAGLGHKKAARRLKYRGWV